MPILRLSFCLLLLTGFSRYSLAQIAEDESPSGPIQFGLVEVKDGDFTVTEFVPKKVAQQVEQAYTVELEDKTTETRTRTVVVETQVLESNQYFVPDEAISFFTTTGKRVTDIEAVRKMLLKGSRPAAIKHDPSPIGQIDQKDVKPNLIVVQIDSQGMDVSRYLQRGQNLYYGDKEYAKAIAEFELATKVSPQYSESWRLKADALATCPVETIRDGKTAVAAAKESVRLLGEQTGSYAANCRRTLAAAYAAAGDFGQAATTLEAAIKLLGPEGKDMEDDFRRNLALFKSKRIYIVEPEACLRILIDSTGTNAFQAKFVSLASDKLTLQELDGKTIELPLSQLSDGDREWARTESCYFECRRHLDRSEDFHHKREYAKAIAECMLAINTDPENAEAWSAKAQMLATCPDGAIRDGEAAVAAANEAVRLKNRNLPPGAFSLSIEENDGGTPLINAGESSTILAIARASAGDFAQAVTNLEELLRICGGRYAPMGFDKDAQDAYHAMLVLFKSKQIYIDDPEADLRVIIDSTGSQAVQASFVRLAGDKVTLKKLDGKTVEIPLSRLSESDREWAREKANSSR